MEDTKLIESFELDLPLRRRPGKCKIRKKVKAVKWTRHKELGRGSFGVVWLEKGSNGEERALKEIEKKYLPTEFDYRRELLATAKLSEFRGFFVDVQGWYDTRKALCIAMEYFPYGTLQDCIREVSESETKQIIQQILRGLCHMHSAEFVHRDLKPENIFVKAKGRNWKVKIGGFGLTKSIENSTNCRTRVGTLLYQAPEILGWIDEDLDEYTEVVDIWSMGCLAYTLLAREPMTEREVKQYSKGMKRLPVGRLKANNISEDAIQFIQALLVPVPNDRLTAHIALQDLWLAPPDTSGNPVLSTISSSEDRKALHSLYLAGFGYEANNLCGPEALYWAVANQQESVIGLLFRNGVDVNGVDSPKTRRTALHFAATSGNRKAVASLLEMRAEISSGDQHGWRAVHLAAAHGHEAAVIELLRHGAHVNMQTSFGKKTALHLAASAGHVDMARLLLREGADSNARCQRGTSPFHCASVKGLVDVAFWMLKAGVDVNHRCSAGRSPLRYAVDHNQRKMVRLLLEHGADVHLKDEGGVSPLGQANELADRAIRRILLAGKGCATGEARGGETDNALAEVQRLVLMLNSKFSYSWWFMEEPQCV